MTHTLVTGTRMNAAGSRSCGQISYI
jgi:hypothetical protein